MAQKFDDQAPGARKQGKPGFLQNVVGLFANGSRSDDEGTAGAPVPRRPRPRPAAPATAFEDYDVFDEDEDDGDDEFTAPNSHLEHYRSLIDSFDEDRESGLEKLIRFFFLAMAYVLPVLVAWAMGKEIGDAYGGPFNVNDGWSLGTHIVALAGEFSLAMMTLSAATALARMGKDPSYAAKFIGSIVAFLLFSLASGLAQWFIAFAHIAPRDTSGFAALVFRVVMVPAVDVAALLFLSVMNFKSLKKFVADQRTRAQAIRDINEAEIEIQRAQSSAARRQAEERQELKMKEARNRVWLQMDQLQADNMIADARRRAALPPPEVVPELPPASESAGGLNQVKVRRVERS